MLVCQPGHVAEGPDALGFDLGRALLAPLRQQPGKQQWPVRDRVTAALERLRALVPVDVLFVADAKRGDIGSTAARQAVALYDVLGDHPDLLYAPIEVKGDAEVHALSRCQMILTEAKKRAAAEFDQALKAAGMTLDQAWERAANDPDLKRASWKLPHRGAAGTAANAVLHMAGKHL